MKVGTVDLAGWIAFAPHADDLALSIGGLLRTVAWTTTDVLVFGRSAWAVGPELRAAGEDFVTRIRLDEERQYCQRVGIHLIDLAFPDASLRGYDAESELTADPFNDPLRGALTSRIADLLAEREGRGVLCPLAVGAHIDHVLTRDAVLASVGEDVPVFLYEDLPYATMLGTQACEDVARSISPALSAVDVPIDQVIAQKINDLSLYRSQLTKEDLQSLRARGHRLSSDGRRSERLWLKKAG